MKRCLRVCALMLLTAACPLVMHAQKDKIKSAHAAKVQLCNVKITLTDKETQEPLVMANCVLQPIGTYGVTDIKGQATIVGVPTGDYWLTVSYVGYVSVSKKVRIVGSDVLLNIPMQSSSLGLNEVVVTAKQKAAGESTGSVIGRQAIDHLQAMSLDDVMQLVPGHLMKNTDLTSKSNMQIRTLVNNNTNAFGASVVLDGVPVSNNGTLTQGGFSSTAFVGTDLRRVSADDVESVEVIRGIPSAEYGDLTSGLVVVHSKVGETPWEVRAKVNPGTTNYSVGKGLRLSRTEVLNFSLDYAQAWGDPRMKTRSYDRYNLSAGYSADFSRKWHTTTKLRFSLGKDWSGNDPDALQDGTYSRERNSSLSLTHNGKIQLGLPLARHLSYTLGVTLTDINSFNATIVANPSGLLPIITATQTGYFSVPYEQTSYAASGGTLSRPGHVYAKVSNGFHVKTGNLYQNVKMGADYNYDWNNARGYYNTDDRYPLRPNSNGRPRPFYDVPGIHRLAAYIEDNLRWQWDDERYLKLQLGARFTALQPTSDVAAYSLSPRVNVAFAPNRLLTIRGGIGWNSKTPSLDYLYPDKRYIDRIAANYMPQGVGREAEQLLLYHTYVYDIAKSKNLRNATSRKMELGVDINLPHERKLSIIAYHDKTANGFGSASEYFTYTANYYSASQGLVTTLGAPTTVDWGNPERADIVFATTGRVGNTNVSSNKGVEFDFTLGRIPAIHTSVFLTGAYMQSEVYSLDTYYANPTNLPASYSIANTVPFKLVYPSGLQRSVYRRFSNNLRLVTNIPALRMVASFSGQAIWYDYAHSQNPAMDPIGWLGTDLTYHSITADMLADPAYTIEGISLQAQRKSGTENVPTKNPVTWVVSARLTKELGKFGTFSFYTNNALFYEPYLSTSASRTLSQRNTGTFSFGVELSVKL